MSTLVNIKSIIKLDNNTYQPLCTTVVFNVTTARFNPCFNCDAPGNGIGSLPHKKDKKKIAANKKKFIKTRQSKGGNGGGKNWDKRSNNKGKANKPQKQQKSDKKANLNVDTNSNNGVHLVDSKWMCLYNKGCGFNTPHTTGFHDTWDACVKNNQTSTLPAIHVFKKKTVAASFTFLQVDSNNGGVT